VAASGEQVTVDPASTPEKRPRFSEDLCLGGFHATEDEFRYLRQTPSHEAQVFEPRERGW
jgi:hypothetical protein